MIQNEQEYRATLQRIEKFQRHVEQLRKAGIRIEEGSRIRHSRFGEGKVRIIDQEHVVIVSNEDHKQHVFRIEGPEIKEAECVFDP